MTDRILVVEDQPRVVRLVSEVLKAVGYQVLVAGDGKHALEMVSLEQPDLVLLDVLLPGDMDGYEICRRLREFSAVPIIMLTARDAEVDRVVGLEMGADDYLTKPFNPRELVARVRAILRRGSFDRLSHRYQFAGLAAAAGMVKKPLSRSARLTGLVR